MGSISIDNQFALVWLSSVMQNRSYSWKQSYVYGCLWVARTYMYILMISLHWFDWIRWRETEVISKSVTFSPTEQNVKLNRFRILFLHFLSQHQQIFSFNLKHDSSKWFLSLSLIGYPKTLFWFIFSSKNKC